MLAHGSLESEILNAVWAIEEQYGRDDISAARVLSKINEKGCIRAYTTIKTVMDRLAAKNILVRYKQGRKFCYNSVKQKDKAALAALKQLVHRYYNDDMRLLMKELENQCLSAKI